MTFSTFLTHFRKRCRRPEPSGWAEKGCVPPPPTYQPPTTPGKSCLWSQVSVNDANDPAQFFVIYLAE